MTSIEKLTEEVTELKIKLSEVSAQQVKETSELAVGLERIKIHRNAWMFSAAAVGVAWLGMLGYTNWSTIPNAIDDQLEERVPAEVDKKIGETAAGESKRAIDQLVNDAGTALDSILSVQGRVDAKHAEANMSVAGIRAMAKQATELQWLVPIGTGIITLTPGILAEELSRR